MPCALSHGFQAHLSESQHGNSLFDIMEWIVGVAPRKFNIWLCIDNIPSNIIYLSIQSPIHKHELGTINLLIKNHLDKSILNLANQEHVLDCVTQHLPIIAN